MKKMERKTCLQSNALNMSLHLVKVRSVEKKRRTSVSSRRSVPEWTTCFKVFPLPILHSPTTFRYLPLISTVHTDDELGRYPHRSTTCSGQSQTLFALAIQAIGKLREISSWTPNAFLHNQPPCQCHLRQTLSPG
jgi:hypothetical protein